MRRGILACLTVLTLWPAGVSAGFAQPTQPAPALGDGGLLALGVALVGAGIAVVRRRSH